MEERQAEELLRKYIAGTCTPGEKRMLDEAFLRVPKLDVPPHSGEQYAQWKATAWQELQKRALETRQPTRRIRRWLPYVAAVLIAVTATTWVFFGDQIMNRQAETAIEILPGTNRATLTLADGRTIDLSEAQTGIIVGEDNITYSDGSDEIANLKSNIVKELVLSTPKGGTYQVTLPDGTKVWLNAASKLSYPNRFDGSERVVSLEGEAFFDVAPISHRDARMPFKVLTDGQAVEVLGTQFNINCYTDEPSVTTTVLEGSVSVVPTGDAPARSTSRSPNRSAILKPGQQSILSAKGMQLRDVDIDEAVDWKNGEFMCHSEPLESIMRKLARWYDVEVEYRDNLSDGELFSGTISRYDNVSTMLRMIEQAGDVRFEIKGRKILVYNK